VVCAGGGAGLALGTGGGGAVSPSGAGPAGTGTLRMLLTRSVSRDTKHRRHRPGKVEVVEEDVEVVEECKRRGRI